MIDLIVSLNGEEFEVRAKGDDYNNELPDFNAAVKGALYAQFLAHPLDPLDSASLEVGVRRVYTDTAAHDGVFDDPESPRADLAERDSVPADDVSGVNREQRDDERNSQSERRQAAARKAAETRKRNAASAE